jgi:hypothetical protein
MHPIWLLAFVTLAAAAGFAIWSYSSTKQQQKTGGHTSGIGGAADPLAGANDKIRSPEALRGALDNAAADKKYET